MERDRVMRSFLSASPSQYAQVHRLSSGEAILLPDADEVYAALTQRNRGLIGSAEQQTLRQAAILIAGCGGIGGAAIEPLVRAGAETFVLADNGEYAYEDANRENLRIQDVGRNKAQVFAQRMPDINPYARFELRDDGVI